ncbi:acyltransferase [Sporolactobacillus sp. THM7-7]|nr:acyltransferase [Sporolactobacillus sp. THM7-7]
MSKMRDSYFDNVKFFLILLVVFGHSLTNLKSEIQAISSLYTFIFLFHMPAFILISGYFSKHFQRPGYVKKIIKKLAIPYIIFQIAYSAFFYIAGYEPNFSIPLTTPHWTLWFLVSMLCWKMMIIPFSRMGILGLPAAIAVGIAAGYVDFIGTLFSLSRTLVFFPFFYLGYLLRKEHFAVLRRVRVRIFALPFLVAIYSSCTFVFPESLQTWVLHNASYHALHLSNGTGGLIRLGIYTLTAATIFSFMSLIPKGRRSFTDLGRNTLYIYLLHGFFIKTIVLFPVYESIRKLYQYSFLLAASIALCYLLASRPVRRFTGPIIEVKLPGR